MTRLDIYNPRIAIQKLVHQDVVNPRIEDPTVGLCLGPYGGPRGGGRFLVIEVSLYMASMMIIPRAMKHSLRSMKAVDVVALSHFISLTNLVRQGYSPLQR